MNSSYPGHSCLPDLTVALERNIRKRNMIKSTRIEPGTVNQAPNNENIFSICSPKKFGGSSGKITKRDLNRLQQCKHIEVLDGFDMYFQTSWFPTWKQEKEVKVKPVVRRVKKKKTKPLVDLTLSKDDVDFFFACCDQAIEDLPNDLKESKFIKTRIRNAIFEGLMPRKLEIPSSKVEDSSPIKPIPSTIVVDSDEQELMELQLRLRKLRDCKSIDTYDISPIEVGDYYCIEIDPKIPYSSDLHKLLELCGDVELNPGPCVHFQKKW